MDIMKKLCKWIAIYMMAILPISIVSCSDDKEDEIPKTPIINPTDPEDDPDEEPEEEPTVSYYTDPKYYAGFFGYNVLSDVYLWKKEIESSLNNWKVSEDPIAKVQKIRYKNSAGEDIDKWTMMTDDYAGFTGGVSGVSTTYGYDFQLYYKDNTRTTLVAVITFTYPDSPAQKAGLKRGDAIYTVNGKEITIANYADLLLNSPTGEFAVLNDNRDGYDKISMTAVNMYLNPVLTSKIFESNGKKIGYLAYTSFTLESCGALIDVCKEFKKQNVTELILDLRYNGGGYVITENLLASMLAPADAVTNKEIFQTEVWNEEYMAYYKEKGEDLNTYFQTEYKFTDYNNQKHSYSTADVNVALNKIYALVGTNSASASEAVLVGLMPYMDIQIIGMQTHGKYCTGWMLSATDWFSDIEANFKKNNMSFVKEYPQYEKWETYAKNWGIYVMISRYADKNGDNPCMPDGLVPHIEVKDNPEEPYELGDDREALLRVALKEAGVTDLTPLPASSRSTVMSLKKIKNQISTNPLDGKRIVLGGREKPYQLKDLK